MFALFSMLFASALAATPELPEAPVVQRTTLTPGYHTGQAVGYTTAGMSAVALGVGTGELMRGDLDAYGGIALYTLSTPVSVAGAVGSLGAADALHKQGVKVTTAPGWIAVGSTKTPKTTLAMTPYVAPTADGATGGISMRW